MSKQEKAVVVIVDALGNVSVEVEGVQGSGCLALTESLEADLGSVTKRVRKQDSPVLKQQAAQTTEQLG